MGLTPYNSVDVGSFFKEKYPNLPCETTKSIFISLTKNDKIKFDTNNSHDYSWLCGRHPTIANETGTVFTLKLMAHLTESGRKDVEDLDFKNQLHLVNDSVKTTNYWVKRTSIASAVIALLTLIYIALDYYKDTSTNLEPLREEIKSTQTILDSIRVYQKGSEASLRTLAEDSIKNVSVNAKHD